jgi:phosphoribosyl-AMP cyclohydrolase
MLPLHLALATTLLAVDFRVDLGEARLVAAGPAEEKRWGRWQFPTLEQGRNELLLFVHVEQDSAASYGKQRRVYVSRDRGRSWTEDAHASQRAYGLRLTNGEWLRTETVAATPAASIALPKLFAERVSYRTPYQLYRMHDLPASLRQIFFQRFRQGAWHLEQQTLDDPHALRYATGGLIPQIWWGDIKLLPDGRLVALTYPYYHDSQPTPHTASAAYVSHDRGRKWEKVGQILYEEPDQRRDGFTEPALERLPDGTLLAVLRTTDGHGVGPMYQSRSKDGGRTWSKPEAFTETGVLPRLLQLQNGVLVLSSGRPGVDLRFSRDGGATWSAPRQLVPIPDATKVQADSCGYTSLLPLGRDRFLITYSWFTPPTGRKSIYTREIRVR